MTCYQHNTEECCSYIYIQWCCQGNRLYPSIKGSPVHWYRLTSTHRMTTPPPGEGHTMASRPPLNRYCQHKTLHITLDKSVWYRCRGEMKIVLNRTKHVVLSDSIVTLPGFLAGRLDDHHQRRAVPNAKKYTNKAFITAQTSIVWVNELKTIDILQCHHAHKSADTIIFSQVYITTYLWHKLRLHVAYLVSQIKPNPLVMRLHKRC